MLANSTYWKKSTLSLFRPPKKIWMSDVPRKKNTSTSLQRIPKIFLRLDVPDRKLGSMVGISGLSQYTPFISRWNNPFTIHLLAIDPITSRDIQVSTTVLSSVFCDAESTTSGTRSLAVRDDWSSRWWFVERYNTPLEHTQSAIPLPNYERIPAL